MALTAPGGSWEPYSFERRDLRPDDVAVRVTWCGVCHSDLHAAEALTAGSAPLVPGHEFVGEVTAVGGEATAFRVGDQVAVGNIVDSCGTCTACRAGQEQFCAEFPTLTYDSDTPGGYSREYVVQARAIASDARCDGRLRPSGCSVARLFTIVARGL